MDRVMFCITYIRLEARCVRGNIVHFWDRYPQIRECMHNDGIGGESTYKHAL